MTPTITVRHQGQLRCEAKRDKSGQVVYTDVTADHGGLDEYFSPIELTAAAVACCVSSVMGIVAKRSEVDLSGMEIKVGLEMAAGSPRRIGSIHLSVHIPNGQAIPGPVRQKLEAAAYACPVKNSLSPEVQVAFEFIYE
jgi:putative redox protein